FNAKHKLRGKIHFISDTDFKNMYMLYNLYNSYYGSADETDINCVKFINNFKLNYDKCLSECYVEGVIKICNVLKSFKNLYELNKFPYAKTCQKNTFLSLPELSTFHSHNDEKLTNNKIGKKLAKVISFHSAYGLHQISPRKVY
ncbi:hypothetical protein PVMG_04820, partial [Plasmodium vivax Mauritania I]